MGRVVVTERDDAEEGEDGRASRAQENAVQS